MDQRYQEEPEVRRDLGQEVVQRCLTALEGQRGFKELMKQILITRVESPY